MSHDNISCHAMQSIAGHAKVKTTLPHTTIEDFVGFVALNFDMYAE